MKITKYLSVAVLLLLMTGCFDNNIYMSPKGSDNGDGTKSNPVASLEKAKEIASQRPDKKTVVIVEDGEYLITKTLRLTSEDSGSEKTPTVYRAARGASPVFTGSKKLTDWKRLQTAETVDESLRNKIFVTDLRLAGITDFGDPVEAGKRPELYCNDKLQTLARWPDDAYTHAGKALGATDLPDTYIHIHGTKEGVFEYLDERQNRWAKEEAPHAGGYWYWDWYDNFYAIASLDTVKHIVNIKEPFHHYGFRDSLRYYGLNLLCELDRPGEWYLQRSTGLLFWYPPSGIDPSTAKVRITVFAEPYMLEIKDCQHVTFDGLTFCESRGSAALIEGGSNNMLKDCRIERFGHDGVHIRGGTNHGVSGCYLSDFGHSIFKIYGGDRKTLTPSGHFVENTVAENFSLFHRTYEPAIYFEGCGLTVAHNRFSNSSSSAMRLEGNEILVEYNEISSVVNESDDQGGIDMHYNPSYRGVVIRYNRWSDIHGGTRHGAAGVRFDDMISGMKVYGNIFDHCGAKDFGGVQIHGGKDNIVSNNVFYHCPFAVSFSTWNEKRYLEALDGEYMNNKLYKQVDINSPLWQEKYPELKTIRENINVNTIENNLIISCDKPFREEEYNILRNNVILDAGDQPVDAFCTDEVLKKYGLESIPYKEIGVKSNKWIK